MCNRAMLLDSGKRKILIDTGIGYKLPKKVNEIYSVDFSEYTLEKSLLSSGIKPEEITDVILTHLHFDHVGGCTYFDDEKQLRITFPNAIHYVQKNHYKWALNPSNRDKASFFPANYEPLEKAKLLNLVDGDFEFDDNISLIQVNGHTRSMQVVKISGENETVVYMADLIPMAAHVPLPFIMGYDLFPLITLEEKRKFLSEAVNGNWTYFLEHDPEIMGVKIGFEADKFFVKEKI